MPNQLLGRYLLIAMPRVKTLPKKWSVLIALIRVPPRVLMANLIVIPEDLSHQSWSQLYLQSLKIKNISGQPSGTSKLFTLLNWIGDLPTQHISESNTVHYSLRHMAKTFLLNVMEHSMLLAPTETPMERTRSVKERTPPLSPPLSASQWQIGASFRR